MNKGLGQCVHQSLEEFSVYLKGMNPGRIGTKFLRGDNQTGLDTKESWVIPLITFLVLSISITAFATPKRTGINYRESLRSLEGLGVIIAADNGKVDGYGLEEDQIRIDVQLKLRLVIRDGDVHHQRWGRVHAERA